MIGLPESPYKGLMPYSEGDALFFFGRNADREIITANLMAARLTLLYGASGVGKSSVLRAGVAHHLNELAQQNVRANGRPEFAVVVFTAWRDEPLTDLIHSVEEAAAKAVNDQAPGIETPAQGFIEILQAHAQRVGGDLFIILDQFEEYFLYHPYAEGPGTFAGEFVRAINDPNLRANFLISIREDTLAKLDRFKGRIPNLFDNYLRIDRLSREAAQEAIEKPLVQYNRLLAQQQRLDAASEQPISIEPALVDAVLEQVKAGQVVLGEGGRGSVEGGAVASQVETPYLQLVMTRLWHEEMGVGSRVLRLATLERLGGAVHIVETHLDNAMKTLTAPEQEIVARVFHQLVTPGGAKIAHSVADLAQYAELPQDQLEPVLKRLTDQPMRILRPVAPPPDRPTVARYEIYHDVLAPAILDWRTRFVAIQKQAAREAEECQREAAQQRELEHAQALARTERLRAQEAEARAKEQARSARVLRLLVTALVVALLVAVWALLHASHQRNAALTAQGEAETAKAIAQAGEAAALIAKEIEVQAQATAVASQRDALTQREIATSRQLAAQAMANLESDPQLTLLLGVEALTVTHTIEAESALRQALLESRTRVVLRGHTDKVNMLTFSANGRWLATASDDKTVRVWEVETRKELALLPHKGEVLAVVFSLTEDRLTTVSRDGFAHFWVASTGEEMTGPDLEGMVGAAAFSDDGRLLASGGLDGATRIWDIEQDKALALLSGHTARIKAIAFSPDGVKVATASLDGTARLWEVTTGKGIALLTGHTTGVNALAFSPDGRLLATAGADGTARLWDAATGAERIVLRGHDNSVTVVAFSPDGQRLATGSVGRTAKLWDVATGELLFTLSGHSDAINALSFSPDAQFLATASADGSARLWNAVTGKLQTTLQGHTGSVGVVLFSRNGDLLATAGADGTARIWAATESEAQDVLRGHEAAIYGVAFNPQGNLLATSSDDRTVRLWDMAVTEAGQDRLRMTLKGDEPFFSRVAFSPDGTLLAAGDRAGVTHLWDVAKALNGDQDAQVVTLHGHKGFVFGVAFSPDGKLLATGSEDGTARLWDIKKVRGTGGDAKVAALSVCSQAVYGVAFSLDGSLLATGCAEGTIRLWDVATVGQAASAEALAVLGNPGDTVVGMAFNRDLLAAGSADGTVYLWDYGRVLTTGITEPSAALRGHSDLVIGVAFNADGSLLATVSTDGTSRLWDIQSARRPGGANAEIAVQQGYEGGVFGVAFNPTGDVLAAGGGDRSIRLWTVGVRDLLVLACQRVVRNLTQSEWETFFGANQPYRKTCPDLPVHPSVIEAMKVQAQAEIRQGKMKEALAILRQAKELDPRLTLAPEAEAASLLVARGRELASQGQVEEALVVLRQAKELDHSVEVGRVLAECGRELASQGQVEEALVVLHQARELDRRVNVTQELAECGRELAGLGKVHEALAVFAEVRQLDPTLEERQPLQMARLYHDMCSQASGQNNLTPAVPDLCQRAVTLAVATDDAYLNFSLCRQGMVARLAEMVEPACERAAELAQPLAFGQSVTGTLSAGSGDLWTFKNPALQVVTIAMNRSQGQLDAYLTLVRPDGSVLAEVGSGGSGNARISDFALYETGVYTIVARGRGDGAGSYTLSLKRETRSKPELASLLVVHGRELAGLGKVHEALAVLRRARELDPTLEERQPLQMARLYHEVCRQAGDQNNLTPAVPDLCQRAVTLAVATDDAYLNFSLCGRRSIAGLAEMVEPACERAAELAQPLAFGQSVTGTLSAGSGDLWTFKNPALQVVTIAMNRSQGQLDAYLTLVGPDGSVWARDGSSGGGGTARLGDLALYKTGVYTVVARGLGDGAGSYTLFLKPEARSKPELASLLVAHGRELAGLGKVHEALAIFDQALALDPSLDVKPVQEAKEIAATVLIAQANEQVRAGQTASAVATLKEAQAIAREINSGALHFAICRLQTSKELAEVAATACEALAAQTPLIRPGLPVTGAVRSALGDPWKLEIASSSRVTITLSAAENSELDPYLMLFDAGFRLIAEHDDIERAVIKDSVLYDLALVDPGLYWIGAGRCCPDNDQGSTGVYVLEVTLRKEE